MMENHSQVEIDHKKEETFQYGPYDVTCHVDGTETWKEGDWSIKIDPKDTI
jgi:hypothetical protein